MDYIALCHQFPVQLVQQWLQLLPEQSVNPSSASPLGKWSRLDVLQPHAVQNVLGLGCNVQMPHRDAGCVPDDFRSYHQTTSEGATPPTSRSAVTNGEYASSSEVVREALRDWQLRRSLHQKE